MQISFMLEAQTGLTWELWKNIVAQADNWGIAGLYTADHFTRTTPPDYDALEMMMAAGYAAAFTKHVTLGPLVSPISVREPVMLTRQALMVNELSEGRFILGVGAGWLEREHHMFGYNLGDIPTRMARFAEGLQVVHLLAQSQGPVSFHGKFFNLNEAELKPRHHKMRILVGGNGVKKTLKLTAQYADVWNGVGISPETFRERSAILDEYAKEAGRDPKSIKRTHSVPLFFGDSPAELESRYAFVRTWRNDYAIQSTDELTATFRKNTNSIIGSRAEVIERIREYAAAGVEELNLQWYNPTDIAGMQAFAQDILPHAQ